MIKKLPLPIVGLGLGLVALGNLLGSYSPVVRYILGAIGCIIQLLFTIKIFTNNQSFKEDMNNPVMASVFATYPMSLVLLSAYILPFVAPLAQILFYGGIILHVILALYFTSKFVLKPEKPKLHASYFIIYAGLSAAGIVATPLGNPGLGKILVIAALVTFIPIFFLVTNRYMTLKEIPDMLKPVKGIYAAPSSLIMAAYMSAFEEKSMTIVMVAIAICQILYLIGLVVGVKYAFKNFFPSFSSFTFPFVISAIALKMTTGFFAKQSLAIAGSLSTLVLVETVIAAFFVIYVFIRYMGFLSK